GATFILGAAPTTLNAVPLAADNNAQAAYMASAFNNYAIQKGISVRAFATNGVVSFLPATGGGAAPPAPVPTGAAPITLSESTPAAVLAALTPTVTIGGVSIGGAPTVTFAVSDGPATNNAIIGLGYTTKNSTATYPSLSNISFSLAKLVPGTNGSPSKWVSYIVTTVPTTVVASVPTRPSADNTGTLVDNRNGTYTYTFFRDITKVKDTIAAAAVIAPNNTADLGDLTYDPNLTHRLTIQIGGNVRGTGTNTADGVQVTTGVPMANPVNVIYDFIPATGKAVTATDPQRVIVVKESCNECHGKLGGIPGSAQSFHGGIRYDPKYCVVCHTDQRRYGRTEATITGLAFSGSTYLVDGRAIGNLPNHIHKIHMGAMLVKTGYNYANVLYNEIKFPQDIRNCTKCHDGSATAANKTPQGDNWKNVPSRLACGACHDGIDFATGKGTTLAGATTGHIGGAKADDSQCVLCHDSASNSVYHLPVTPPNPNNGLVVAGGTYNTNAAWIAANRNNLPQGAIKVSYEIGSVSKNANKQPAMVFRMLQNGAPVPFNDRTTKTEIWDNFYGSPGVYFVFAVPQDGIAAPADFNASIGSYLRNIWNGTATGSGAGTLTGPDANGYYTVTFTGVTIPDSAVMLTGGLGYMYNVLSAPPLTQANLAEYPVSQSAINAAARVGGLIVAAGNAWKVATGYTGRRAIVENARCNKCHEFLGAFTAHAFHGGQRNDAPTCSWCHTPNRTSSGWSADSSSYIHAIHAGAKRSIPFTWHAASTTESYADIRFPGILKNCETCHLPGTYDFSAAASAAALPNRLYRTVGQGIYNGFAGTVTTGTTVTQTDLGVFSLSPYVTKDNATNYGTGFSFNAGTGVTTAAAGTTLVNSPMSAACLSCHDSDLAKLHMDAQGGSIYQPRTTALAKSEMCTLCHLAGKVADIKAMHAR
ncbi:MAG: OmcA/MtrC family decaheme c-type cytochrome, partial [Betaproteobacteria bacterium]|nr:OmcA/MtrC family decaheme c-type cytochrome [Betaproteobacteria bacterium]